MARWRARVARSRFLRAPSQTGQIKQNESERDLMAAIESFEVGKWQARLTGRVLTGVSDDCASASA